MLTFFKYVFLIIPQNTKTKTSEVARQVNKACWGKDSQAGWGVTLCMSGDRWERGCRAFPQLLPTALGTTPVAPALSPSQLAMALDTPHCPTPTAPPCGGPLPP